MAGMHWIFQLVIIGFIAAIDYSQHEAVIGFFLAAYYLLASLWSLFSRDMLMFRRRAFLFAVLVCEVIAVGSLSERPPDLGFLDRWVQKLAK